MSAQPGRFKGVGGRSEYSIYTVWRCVGRGPLGSCEPPEPPYLLLPGYHIVGNAPAIIDLPPNGAQQYKYSAGMMWAAKVLDLLGGGTLT